MSDLKATPAHRSRLVRRAAPSISRIARYGRAGTQATGNFLGVSVFDGSRFVGERERTLP